MKITLAADCSKDVTDFSGDEAINAFGVDFLIKAMVLVPS